MAESESGAIAEPSEEFQEIGNPDGVVTTTDEMSSDGAAHAELGVLLEIGVNLSIEMGSRTIKLKDLLKLSKGSVLELDKTAGDPLDLKVNGSLVARGEVVVVNGKYGIRLTEVVSKSDRMKNI